MIYGHGDDVYAQDFRIKSNFSSNVFERGTPDWLRDFLIGDLSFFTSYPEPNATSFVELLASQNGIKETEVCATHGATDAIYLIAQTFAQCRTAIMIPTFSEYEDACRINKHSISYISNLEEIDHKSYELVWICNPNNPTGATCCYESLLKVIDSNLDTVFVIDQTYRYFTKKRTLSYEDAVKRSNVVLIDSFTKRFALPDLRLGYFIANSKLVEKIQYYKQPWAVSQLAIQIGKFVLQTKPYPLDLEELLLETSRLNKALNAIEGIEAYPTDTHFFLCKIKKGTVAVLKQYLLKNYGVLIRDASNFQSLDFSFFRIATQKREKNEELVIALEEYINKK